MHDETWLRLGAVCSNLLLLFGIVCQKPSLFLPWMLVYGAELTASWMVGLVFVVMQDVFAVAGLVAIARAALITYCWILVRRHMKEVNDMASRPRLQTIFSIVTAHPFSPRPALELSEQPPLPDLDA